MPLVRDNSMQLSVDGLGREFLLLCAGKARTRRFLWNLSFNNSWEG